jgi:hypothetical protein
VFSEAVFASMDTPDHSSSAPGDPTLRKLPLAPFIVITVLFCGFFGGCWWLKHDFEEKTKSTQWHRDGPPTAEVLKRLTDSGLPSSITRVVESGTDDGWLGDGVKVEIYCFPPSDVPAVQKAIGKWSGSQWAPGLPSQGLWVGEERVPKDLKINPEADPGNFIHIPTGSHHHYIVIDISRGIAYVCRLFT